MIYNLFLYQKNQLINVLLEFLLYFSMSSAYYSQRWEEAIGDLLEAIQEENLPLEENKQEKGISFKRTDLQWFYYYACLYVRYVQIYRKLEDAYDQIVHPQKRILMKTMLENVMVRMCQVKQNLIHYNTHTQIVQGDFVNIDQVILDMKLNPKCLQVPIPKFFTEKQSRDEVINKIVGQLGILEEEQCFMQAATLDTDLSMAIRIIQKLQRGRQGMFMMVEAMKTRKNTKEKNSDINEQELMPTIIQKYWRAFLMRRQLAAIKDKQLRFLGIKKQPIDQQLLSQAQKQRKYLKMVQKDREKKFEKQQTNLKKEIRRTQEHNIMSKMLDERRKWIQKYLQMHEFTNLPANSADFYKKKEPQPEQDKKQKKKEKGSDDKNKKPKKNQVDKFLEQHIAVGPTQSVLKAQQAIKSYTESWGTRDCTQVQQQIFDIEMARDKLRPNIEKQLQKIVDEEIGLELDKMRIKYGIKKKKQKKKKKKKNKQKKIKIPQGLGKKQPKQLLEQLFEKGIAKRLKPSKMNQYLGQHNPLRYLVQKTATTMPDPSFSQIRQIVAMYLGIPLGSQLAKQKLEKWSWFLFYGATGTGKSMMIRTLQHQTNALVFDLTPDFVKDIYAQKAQLTKLIWSVIICAKHFQPAIVLIDEIETVFPGAKVKKSKQSAPSFGPKMKKPIIDLKKNKLWAKQDRIAVIACTNKPFGASVKEMKKLFDKQIYFPFPNYATRKLLIQHFIEKKLGTVLSDFPYDVLAHVSEGFTAGSYKQCIQKVLNEHRLTRLKDQPLRLNQFIGPLSNTTCVFGEQYQKIKLFTDQVTGLKQRRQLKNSNNQEENKKDKNKKK